MRARCHTQNYTTLTDATLLDAFVDILEPLFTRFASQARWIAVMEADGFSIYEVRKGHPTLRAHGNVDDGMAEFVRPGRGSTIELRLPQDQVLHRTLRLPAAGRNFLERIVEHRLERLTPWNPEKMLYGFRIVGEEGSDGTITVAFAATSSDIVAEPVRRLQKLGLPPYGAWTAAEPIDAPLGLDLYRGSTAPAARRSGDPSRWRCRLLRLRWRPPASPHSGLRTQARHGCAPSRSASLRRARAYRVGPAPKPNKREAETGPSSKRSGPGRPLSY